jgi:hypothetical protein
MPKQNGICRKLIIVLNVFDLLVYSRMVSIWQLRHINLAANRFDRCF